MKFFSLSFEKSVGAVVFMEEEGDRKYLLLHYISGHWDFPKGHVEKGEREHETLKREVLEETGINDLQILPGFKTSMFYSYKPGKEERKKKNGTNRIFKKVSYYIAKTNIENIQLSEEHRNSSWFFYEDAIRKITHDNGRNILEKVEEFLGK